VLHWSKSCLAVPPASEARGTGHHQEFSARNVIDLAIVRELVDHGLTLRRIRAVMAACRYEPYYARDQRAATEAYLKRFSNLPSDLQAPSYDYLILYRERLRRRGQLVGRATGKGSRWWEEKQPKRVLHEFVDLETLTARAVKADSVTVINLIHLRDIVHQANDS
jgi:DNA-binding transcriptional MerR regulator